MKRIDALSFRGLLTASVLLAAFLAVLLSGCSGTRRRGPSVAEPGTTGSLSTVRIQPTPGTTFIARSTIFRLVWNADLPPPSVFSASLRRYKEARGEEPRTIDTQVTELVREGDDYVWLLRRRDGFDLDQNGVYYLELTGGGETVLATYIISGDRSQATPTIASEPPASWNTGAEANGKSVGETHTVSTR